MSFLLLLIFSALVISVALDAAARLSQFFYCKLLILSAFISPPFTSYIPLCLFLLFKIIFLLLQITPLPSSQPFTVVDATQKILLQTSSASTLLQKLRNTTEAAEITWEPNKTCAIDACSLPPGLTTYDSVMHVPICWSPVNPADLAAGAQKLLDQGLTALKIVRLDCRRGLRLKLIKEVWSGKVSIIALLCFSLCYIFLLELTLLRRLSFCTSDPDG